MESWVEQTRRSVAPMSVVATSLPSVLELGIPLEVGANYCAATPRDFSAPFEASNASR